MSPHGQALFNLSVESALVKLVENLDSAMSKAVGDG
jgi:hypothetical protein